MVLSEEQYSKLEEIGVFDNKILELDKIPIALEAVTQLINDNKELVRLKEMLSLANFYKTIVGFDF